MLMDVVSGGTDGPERVLSQRRLEFAHDLARHGRITEDDVPACTDRPLCQGHLVARPEPSLAGYLGAVEAMTASERQAEQERLYRRSVARDWPDSGMVGGGY